MYPISLRLEIITFQLFSDNLIDGSCLPKLTETHLTSVLGMKLGPAIKLITTIKKNLPSEFYKSTCHHCNHCHRSSRGNQSDNGTWISNWKLGFLNDSLLTRLYPWKQDEVLRGSDCMTWWAWSLMSTLILLWWEYSLLSVILCIILRIILIDP